MIQDIAPHRLVNAYDPAARPGETDFVLAFREGKALLRAGERPAFLRRKEFPADCSLTYLFTVDASPFYLCTDETAVPLESSRFSSVSKTASAASTCISRSSSHLQR